MSEIDWDKAPEWADKYGVAGPEALHFWYSDNQYAYVSDPKEVFIFSNFDTFSHHIKDFTMVGSRPSTAWSGEGFPPVGVVCEANFVGEWTSFEMRYYGEAYVVFKTAFEVQRTRNDFDTCGVKFRPVRTAEQIAADEREAAIEQIEGIIAGFSYRHCAELIHDAGYRKQDDK